MRMMIYPNFIWNKKSLGVNDHFWGLGVNWGVLEAMGVYWGGG